jgi:hypothetical protein
MTIPSPYGPYGVNASVITSGGDALVPKNWKEPDITVRITTPMGDWMNLDDHERYILAADSFQQSATQMRRNQVQGPYVAGKFTVYAVPDQVTETVSLYVLGANQTELQLNLQALVAAFTQPNFALVWSADEAAYQWDCEAADYTIDFVNTNVFARTLNVKFQVPRNPTLVMGSLY